MLTFGAVTLAQPWALMALFVLPGLFFLLKLFPPSPVRIPFPPVRFLLYLKNRHETPAEAPWWLLLLRVLIFIFLIIAVSQPVLNAGREIRGNGPLYLIVDNGWASAQDWNRRKTLLENLLSQAKREGRAIGLVTTAPKPASTTEQTPFQLMTADDAGKIVRELTPYPWPTDRAKMLAPLLDFAERKGTSGQPGHVYWLGNGLEEGGAPDLMARLKVLGAMTVVQPDTVGLAILRPPVPEGDRLGVTMERIAPPSAETYFVRALSDKGQLLARKPVEFSVGQARQKVTIELPSEHRNQLARLEIENQPTAASRILIDERWRRRPVGLIADRIDQNEQTLLSGHYYLKRAFQPFAEVRTGKVQDLLARKLALLVMVDEFPIEAAGQKKIEDWVKAGGVLIRFAGPKLAETGTLPSDNLTPVRLRTGARVLGGRLAWRSRAKLGSFKASSPFHGLEIPADVRISKQVLAHPSLELADKTWVSLEDGTPLVTAQKVEAGWSVLFHVTANADWSSLPMSGLFVDMLDRLLGLSQGVDAVGLGPPFKLKQAMDGFGNLVVPKIDAAPIAAKKFLSVKAGYEHPPGVYGRGQERRALNLSATLTRPNGVGPLPENAMAESYGEKKEQPLAAFFVSLALFLFFIDFLISLMMRGVLKKGRMAVSSLVLIGCLSGVAQADDYDGSAPLSALETRLAYVVSGNGYLDRTAEAGLWGLGVIAKRRTAAELAPPVGIDPERDELAFYPLIYWPVQAAPVSLSEEAARRVNHYLRHGGTILFDTLEQGDSRQHPGLASLIDKLDIPPLEPVQEGHVLGRSFYLMSSFPGRWIGGKVWVEQEGRQANDGVSSVVIGSHDWAGAWAMDDQLTPLFPVVPGGDRQREMAYRFGINLLMYALTGNYKADQVHLPAIMKRLGR